MNIHQENEMSAVKVEKQKSPASHEASALVPFNPFFDPAFSTSRFFGPSPFFPTSLPLMQEFGEVDRFLRGRGPATETWAPAIDIEHCNGDLVVTAELPGLKKEEVKVEVTDNALIIEGERTREHKTDHEGYHRYERSCGKFYRSIPLPEGARTDQAKAEINEGVLKITVPAPQEKKTVRQVEVKQAA
jgi:HSP20 family molecular chaperone IbpA